jgi:hypothetical protein
MSTLSVYLSSAWRLRHGTMARYRYLLIYMSDGGGAVLILRGDPATRTWRIRLEHGRQAG